MQKYTSIADFYHHLSQAQFELLIPIIAALEDFGTGKLQWNMPVYYKDNHIIRKTKNQSRWYFGLKSKTGGLYLGFYDIDHFIAQYPQVRGVFDQIQKISGQIFIHTLDDVDRAVALIQLSQTL